MLTSKVVIEDEVQEDSAVTPRTDDETLQVAEGYRAMDERRAIKSLLHPKWKEVRESTMSTWSNNFISQQPAFQHALVSREPNCGRRKQSQRCLTERTTNMKIRIRIADKVVIATVADNATARDFVSASPFERVNE